MSPVEAAFIHSAEIEKYGYPPDCPFNTTRAAKTRQALESMGLLTGQGRRQVPPVAATRDELLKFHTSRYVDALASAATQPLSIELLRMGLGTPDCPIFTGMYDCATLAAGGSLVAARLILEGRADVAFNPSGGYHHARAEAASGFCYINDVVLACMVLAEAGKRVLFVDIDVHHADGVQAAFYDRDDVMTISMHESGRTLFPGTGFPDEIGAGAGEGFSVNIPLPMGTYDEAYLDAFSQVAVPLAGAYDPDVVVMEIGMDALAGDPLAHLSLTNNAHAEAIEAVKGLAKPILATGGGGYNVANAARGWALAWSMLCGEDDRGDMNAGLGGVMLESTDWAGGLRDRVLVPSKEQIDYVAPAVQATIEAVKANVFPIHGLDASA